MRIAVTGATGFVGGEVVRYLSGLGHEVVPIVRKNRTNIPGALEWDISKSYDGTFSDVEYVVHAAAVVDDGVSYEEAYSINVEGTENVLNAFSHARRFIYISSASVYDPTHKAFVVTEESPVGTHLLNGYSKTKFEAEECVAQHKSQSQKIILRPHVIYGPGDQKIIPRLLRADRMNRFLVLGDGLNHISVTHIENLCSAVAQSIDIPLHSPCEVFNIADEKPVQINNLLLQVKSVYGITAENFYIGTRTAYWVGSFLELIYGIMHFKRTPIISRYIVHQMTSNHEFSSAKARALLRYRPVRCFTDYTAV